MVKIFEMSWRKRFEALIRPYLREMYSYAYRLCGQRDRAEDIVQDLVLRLYKSKAAIDQVENLRPWLYKSLFRQYLNNKRSESRSPFAYIEAAEEEFEEYEEQHQSSLPEALTEQHLQKANLLKAMECLAPEFHEILVIHDIESFNVQETADILDIPVGTVKSRVHRARNKLRKILVDGTEQKDSVLTEVEGNKNGL